MLAVAFFLFLAFFVVWGASLFWNADLPYPMNGLLPAAKAAGRGMTFTLSLLYLTTLRSTQTALRGLLHRNWEVTDWLVGAIPFHALMPHFHATLGVVAFVLAVVHTVCGCLVSRVGSLALLFSNPTRPTGHAADYVIFWGTQYWPVTWYFSVGFAGNRGTFWLLVTGSILFGVFTLLIIVPGVSFYYLRALQVPEDKESRLAKVVTFLKKLVPSHLFFINTHWLGFFLFTVFISIHAQNRGVSDVAVVFWVLGLWSFVDLVVRYLPAPGGGDLQPVKPTAAYYDGGKATGVLLSLPRSPEYAFVAGQYALVRTSFFSDAHRGTWRRFLRFFEGRESHPFSIASPSTDEHRIAFIIGRADGWTRRVFDALDRSQGGGESKSKDLLQPGEALLDGAEDVERAHTAGNLRFTITRPQGAPAQDHRSFDAVLLVGTGVGCTAMMSVFASLVTTVPMPKVELPEMDGGEEHAKGSRNDPNNATKYSTKSSGSIAIDTHCGVPAWVVGATTTLLVFALQLFGALLVTLAAIVEVEARTSVMVVLSLDLVVAVTVFSITVLRVIWFATVLLHPDAWRLARRSLTVLFIVDLFSLVLAGIMTAFDVMGIIDESRPPLDEFPWIYEALAVVGFLSVAASLVRIWTYLHLHSPHSHNQDPPALLRMVLSSTAHMPALEALLGDILAVGPGVVASAAADAEGPVRNSDADWGAVLKVAAPPGDKAAASAPYDVGTFLQRGVRRHAGKRFEAGHFRGMIAAMMQRMHERHADEDRAVFMGVFYCGNQAAVREALAKGMEEVQKEHFEGRDGRPGCQKCFGRVLVETF
ncbi:hypothetical protein DFJ74DRAFT_692999 [Hyaloraphidium curvatum]|nr:hypothetical protein DFJ74DRAFT_692999 [Hyaloraphidium curvatum]